MLFHFFVAVFLWLGDWDIQNTVVYWKIHFPLCSNLQNLLLFTETLETHTLFILKVSYENLDIPKHSLIIRVQYGNAANTKLVII